MTSAAELLSSKPQSVKTHARARAWQEGEPVISPAVQWASDVGLLSLTLSLFVVVQQRVLALSARHRGPFSA